MDSPAIATLIKMMESLPEAEQNRVVEAVRAYIADLQDEAEWDQSFSKSQDQLTRAAQKAKQQIRENNSQPFDLGKL